MHSLPYILHVDDDPDDRLLLLETLPDGYALCSLASGRALLDHLCALPVEALPFLVLLDINMPEMNGWQTLQQLQQFSCFDSIRVVMFTTASPAILETEMQRFQVPVISKPFNYLGLHQCWKEILATVALPVSGLR